MLHESVEDAARVDHPVTLAVALTIATFTVFSAAEDLRKRLKNMLTG